MSAAALFLAPLDRVQQCGTDRWRCQCPAHESKHATRSLSVRELPDGTLLVHCFAGCEIGDIVSAVGLQLRDLFPADHSAPQLPRHLQRPNHWHASREALQTVSHECLVIAIAADDIVAGKPITPADADRVAVAAGRVRAALEACR